MPRLLRIRFLGTEEVAGGNESQVGGGVLTLTGYAPTVTAVANNESAIGGGLLTLTGYAPSTVDAGANTSAAGYGALTLTGYAPLTDEGSDDQTSVLTAGLLALTGYAPAVDNGAESHTVQVGGGALTATGYAPTQNLTEHAWSRPAAGTLTLVACQPAIEGGESEVVRRSRDAGSKRRRRRIMLGDRIYEIQSPTHERRLLEGYISAKRAEAESAEQAGMVEVAQAAQAAVTKARRRLRVVAPQADAWTRRLREDDELILLLLAA